MQTINAQPGYWSLQYLQVDNGFSHTDATCVRPDEKGFIWLGSYSGLNRFDGYVNRVFYNETDRQRTAYLNRISGLSISEKYIWLATEGGLSAFNKAQLVFHPLVAEDSTTQEKLRIPLQRVAVSGNSVYGLTTTHQLLQFATDGNTSIRFTGFVKTEEPVYGIADGAGGDVFAATTNALIIVKPNSSRPIELLPENLPATASPLGVYVQQNGSIQISKGPWLYELSPNLLRRLEQTGQLEKRQVKPGVDFTPVTVLPQVGAGISSVAQFSENEYWIGCFNGLFQYNRGSNQLTQLTQEQQLSSNLVSGLAIDNSSCLWISTFGGGVNTLNLRQNPFYRLQHNVSGQPSLTGNYVRAIAEAPDGNIYIGTRNNGINILNRVTGSVSNITSANTPTLSSNNIRSLHFDRKGQLWIGTEVSLLLRDLNGVIKPVQQVVTNNAKLAGSNFFSICSDVFGNVWAATWDGGVNRLSFNGSSYNLQAFTQRRADGEWGLASNRATYLYADERPEVWISTDKGLDRILLNNAGAPVKMLSYPGNNSNNFSSQFIWPVVRQNDSILYVGTLGGGLNRLQLFAGNKYLITALRDSSAKELRDVESILLDDDGNLWLGGKTLAVYNTTSKHFIHYDENDGLQGNSFKIGAAHKTEDGWLFFGGINGLSYFNPSQIKKGSPSTVVVLTGLEINGEQWAAGREFSPESSVSYSDELILHPNETNIAISFSAMQYGNPQGIRYRYKLQGFDKDWRYTEGLQNRASYDQLDYGNYTFLVEAGGADGRWLNKPATLPITVQAPWYKSILAKIIYVLLIILIGYLIFLYQGRWFRLKKTLEVKTLEEEKKEELHQMKLQFFTNISHEFRTPLTLILGPAEKLMQQTRMDEGQKNYLRIIYGNARRLLGLINELMDFRKAESDRMNLAVNEGNLVHFTLAIASEFKELAAARNIEYILPDAQNDITGYFDKNLLEKVLVNVLANSFKYTTQGTIQLQILKANDFPHPRFSNRIFLPPESESAVTHWIHISDSGRGIPSEQLQEIFDRYFAGEQSADNPASTGVGLALVKNLVTLHKGQIRVYSKPLEGTDFFVGLPLSKNAYSPQEIGSGQRHLVDFESLHYTIEWLDNHVAPARLPVNESIREGSAELNRKRLLVVEDNEEMRRFLHESLQDEYDVLEAPDAEMGLALAKEHMPDAIISDLMLPGMNGVALCQAIRSDIAISHTPFILITAKASVETHIEGVESGADVYFPKPFSIRLLIAAIKNLFDSRSRLKDMYAKDVFAETRQLVNNQKDKEFLDELIALIEAHMESEELDVDLICRKVGMSRTKLYGKIKSVTGQPVGEFVRSLRLKKAARMLAGEDKTILEVMYTVGIQSQSYFTKAFKKEFGKTPSQFIAEFDHKQKAQKDEA